MAKEVQHHSPVDVPFGIGASSSSQSKRAGLGRYSNQSAYLSKDKVTREIREELSQQTPFFFFFFFFSMRFLAFLEE